MWLGYLEIPVKQPYACTPLEGGRQIWGSCGHTCIQLTSTFRSSWVLSLYLGREDVDGHPDIPMLHSHDLRGKSIFILERINNQLIIKKLFIIKIKK